MTSWTHSPLAGRQIAFTWGRRSEYPTIRLSMHVGCGWKSGGDRPATRDVLPRCQMTRFVSARTSSWRHWPRAWRQRGRLRLDLRRARPALRPEAPAVTKWSRVTAGLPAPWWKSLATSPRRWPRIATRATPISRYRAPVGCWLFCGSDERSEALASDSLRTLAQGAHQSFCRRRHACRTCGSYGRFEPGSTNTCRYLPLHPARGLVNRLKNARVRGSQTQRNAGHCGAHGRAQKALAFKHDRRRYLRKRANHPDKLGAFLGTRQRKTRLDHDERPSDWHLRGQLLADRAYCSGPHTAHPHKDEHP